MSVPGQPHPGTLAASTSGATAAATFPSLVLVGPTEETKHVQRALEDIRVLVELVDDIETALHRVGRSTFGVLLFAGPEGGVEEVARLRHSELVEGLPLFVVVSEACSDRRARMLYRAGATVVFAWPSEVLLVPKVIAELIHASAQGSAPQWNDAALAASVIARLELAEGIGRGVTVSVHDAVADVGGVVDSPWKRRRVLRILAQVPGLRSVNAGGLHVVCEPAAPG